APGYDQPRWDREVRTCTAFRDGLAKVRRVLATVPSLMILDDHEVTDDWNLNHPWAKTVYANAKGSRVIFNGVLAYALFQHWGNVPARSATAGATEAQILAAAAHSGASPDTPALRGLLGVPGAAPADPPSVLRDISPPAAMRYDFTLGAADGWPVHPPCLAHRT